MKRPTMYVDKNGRAITENDLVLGKGKKNDGCVLCLFILEYRWPSGNSDYYFTPVNWYAADKMNVRFDYEAPFEYVGSLDHYKPPHVLDTL